MSRLKLFIGNFFIYGGIHSINKLVPLIMLPIITRLIPDPSDYGYFDSFLIISSFFAAFVNFGITDGTYREYFEKKHDSYHKLVISVGLSLVIIFSSIFLLVFSFFSERVSMFFFNTSLLFPLVLLAGLGGFLNSMTNIMIVAPRMNNHRLFFLRIGVSKSIIYYTVAIILLTMNLSYLALVYANLFAGLGIVIYTVIKYWSYLKFPSLDKEVVQKILRIGLPLFPVFIIYWIFNNYARIHILKILGQADLGIYAIGARVATLSLFVQIAFSQGWSFFSYSTMKDQDQVLYRSKIFEYLSVFSIISFFLVSSFAKQIFKLLFVGNYIDGFVVFPFLFLSPLVLMLYQTVANQFTINRRSYFSPISLSTGLVSILVFMPISIDLFGIEGAAALTLISYFISLITACIIAYKMDLLKLKMKLLLVFGILIFVIIWNLLKYQYLIVVNSFSIMATFIIYFNELKFLGLRLINLYWKRELN